MIALRYAIEHPDTIAGLVPMSSFAEIAAATDSVRRGLRTALILGGTTYLQDLLFPDEFLQRLARSEGSTSSDFATHRGWLINDVYALQNLMESFLDFEPLTPKLSAIRRRP